MNGFLSSETACDLHIEALEGHHSRKQEILKVGKPEVVNSQSACTNMEAQYHPNSPFRNKDTAALLMVETYDLKDKRY